MRIRPAYVFHAAFFLLAILWIATRIYVVTRVPKLIIGPQTTVISGPIAADGMIDFEAAFHARFSVGVTPENNAVVVLRRAFGPGNLGPELSRRASRYLGESEPPAKGDDFVETLSFGKHPLGTYCAADSEVNIQLTEALQRTWTRIEFPALAKWIDANERTMTLVKEASLRPKYYSPVVIGDGQIENGFDRGFVRWAVKLLISRAMLRISEGDFESAVQDLITGHRLCSLLSQELIIVAQFVSVAWESRLTGAAEILLAQPLTEKMLQHYRKALASLVPQVRVSETLDQGERLFHLALLQEIRRGTISLNEEMDKAVPFLRFDLSAVMRKTNQKFDALIDAQKIKGLRPRFEAVERLDRASKARALKAISGLSIVRRFAWDSGESQSESTAELLSALLSPAVVQFQSSTDRARVRRDLLTVGLALAAYRAKYGKYPEQLDRLSPDFLSPIPLDQYNDQPLQYRLKPDGYIVYSVGPDRLDNGGQPLVYKEGDIVFRVKHDIAIMP